MKRILFLTHCYPKSKNDNKGIFFRYWIKELKLQNFNIDVITPSYDNSKHIFNKVGDYGEQICFFPCKKKFGTLRFKKLLDILSFFYSMVIWKKAISKVEKEFGNWDLVVAAWGIPAGLLLNHKSLKKTLKVIWWLGSDYHKFKKGLFKFLLKYVLHKTDLNWCDSYEIVHGLKNISNVPIELIPNQPQNFSGNKRNYFRKTPNILSIGNLEKVKNFEFAIKAIKYLIKSGIDLNYEIIGDGSQKKLLLNSIKNEKKIKLLGYKNKDFINEKLKTTDILLITSLTEGNTNVFFEAIAAGVVVISTEVGDLKSILKNTKLGLTSPQDDLNQLILNLLKAINGELNFNNRDAFKIFEEYSSQISIDAVKKLI